MKNLNQHSLPCERDNSGLMRNQIKNVLNKLSQLTQNFYVSQNNSGTLEFRQNNCEQQNTITCIFNDK